MMFLGHCFHCLWATRQLLGVQGNTSSPSDVSLLPENLHDIALLNWNMINERAVWNVCFASRRIVQDWLPDGQNIRTRQSLYFQPQSINSIQPILHISWLPCVSGRECLLLFVFFFCHGNWHVSIAWFGKKQRDKWILMAVRKITWFLSREIFTAGFMFNQDSAGIIRPCSAFLPCTQVCTRKESCRQ